MSPSSFTALSSPQPDLPATRAESTTISLTPRPSPRQNLVVVNVLLPQSESRSQGLASRQQQQWGRRSIVSYDQSADSVNSNVSCYVVRSTLMMRKHLSVVWSLPFRSVAGLPNAIGFSSDDRTGEVAGFRVIKRRRMSADTVYVRSYSTGATPANYYLGMDVRSKTEPLARLDANPG